MDLCKISKDVTVPITTWKGQRVVTYKDIAKFHHVSRDTIAKSFKRHKSELFEGEDYFSLNREEALRYKASRGEDARSSPAAGINELNLITESGYLILACTFRGNEAAMIRRTVVNGYFKAKELSGFRQDVIQAFRCLHESNKQLKKKQDEMRVIQDKQAKDIKEMAEYVKRVDSYFRVTMMNWRLAARCAVEAAYKHDTTHTRSEYYNEMYAEFERDTGVRLKTRKKNLQDKKGEKISILDVIASDKKLVKGFLPVIGSFIMRHHLMIQIERESA